jgi:peroxiredoxin
VIAIAADDVPTMKRFKESLGAPMHFVSDPNKVLINAYGIVMPVTGWAKRTTFVVGPGRKVLSLQEGSEALKPEGAIRACGLHKPGAVETALEGGKKPAWAPDAGVK